MNPSTRNAETLTSAAFKLDHLTQWLEVHNFSHLLNLLKKKNVCSLHDLLKTTSVNLTKIIPLPRECKLLTVAIQRERLAPASRSPSMICPATTRAGIKKLDDIVDMAPPTIAKRSVSYSSARQSRLRTHLYPSPSRLRILTMSSSSHSIMLARRKSNAEEASAMRSRSPGVNSTTIARHGSLSGSMLGVAPGSFGRSKSCEMGNMVTPVMGDGGKREPIVTVPPCKVKPPQKVSELPKERRSKTPSPGRTDEELYDDFKSRLSTQRISYSEFLGSFKDHEVPEALDLLGFTLFEKKRLTRAVLNAMHEKH